MEQEKEEFSLDFQWLKNILVKRAACHSNVVCVATSDPKRVLQLKAYLALCPDYANSQIYCFNPWSGLQLLNRGDGKHSYFQPVQPEEYTRMAGVENKIIDLNTVLRHMGERLQEGRVIFIIEYIDSPRDGEKERYLLYALRSWAHEPQITYQGSLVIVVVGSFSKVLDELTEQWVILERPPIATSEERGYVIDKVARELGAEVSKLREALVKATAGLNLHQLEGVLKEAYQTTGKLSPDSTKKLRNDFIKNSEVLEVAEPSAEGFRRLGGYKKLKDFVTSNIVKVLAEQERARSIALPLPRGFILFGPPGTGKSLFARCLAGEIGLPVINFHVEPLITKWLGETGHRFAEAIRVVEQMSPVILFIDEIDKILIKRAGEASDGASGEIRRLTNQLLEWLGSEERKSILVGATNRPQDLDKAAIRPGRIDYMIPMLYPDVEARRQILEVHLARIPLLLRQEEVDSLLNDLAWKTTYFTGADIEGLVNRAKRYAFGAESNGLLPEHFAKALDTFRIDQAQRAKDVENYLELARQYTNDTEFFSDFQ